MTNLEKLIEITNRLAKDNEWGGILDIQINRNRACYETISKSLIDSISNFGVDSITDDVMAYIQTYQENRTMCEIRLYIRNPAGCYYVVGLTPELAATEMLNAIKKDGYDL